MRSKVSFLAILFTFLFSFQVYAAPTQYIYDYAGLLTEIEKESLENLAAELSAERGIAFIILTTNDTGGQYIEEYMSDFVDHNAVGYEAESGSTAIIALDMMNRDVYLAGFGEAEMYLDFERLDIIRDQLTPALSDGNYEQAFQQFIEQAHYYSEYKPDGNQYNYDSGYYPGSNLNNYDNEYNSGVNPDNLLFKFWFQLLVSVGIAAIVVGIMVANRGGRITVGNNTYIDSDNSGVTNARDTYITTHITKVKKPSNNNKGGGGGFGGGVSGGGRSFSGSGGKF